MVKLIEEAYSSKEMARELVISVKMVERPRKNIPEELGLRDRVGPTRYAIGEG